MVAPIESHKIQYGVKSDFDNIQLKQSRGSGATFGGTSPRFEYYANRQKQGILPSPNDYKLVLITPKGKGPIGHGERRSEFGFGRDRVQKLHVDAIL